MILFDLSRFHRTKGGDIYLSYEQIEKITEELINDYKPQLLTSPGAIENDDFLENYLGVTLDYKYIYSTEGEGDILGCALFSEQDLKVYDKENMCTRNLRYDANTVVLDMSLVEGDRKIQENITGLHEGGHIWLHGPLLRPDPNQIALKNIGLAKTSCRKSGMEEVIRIQPTSDDLWREWQATVFAITIALPRKSLNITVPELFKVNGVEGRQLVTDADMGAEQLSYHTIPETLSQIYNMSKEAIRYRLNKIGFYTTKERYETENAQRSIFDFI